MMDFDRVFSLLIDNEGKLSLDSQDRGNWTSGKVGIGELKGSKYGISAASYPHLNIKDLSLADAKEIYRKDFWNKLSLDKLPEDIAFDLFDTAVNSGVSGAIKILQRTVGTKDDGVIGTNTLSLVSRYGPMLKMHFNARRLQFMTSLPSWDHNSEGWAKRIAHNLLVQ